MRAPQEPEKLDYFTQPKQAGPKTSVIRRAVYLVGFIFFGSVAMLLCAEFVAVIVRWRAGDLPLAISVGLAAAFLVFLSVQEFRDFLR